MTGPARGTTPPPNSVPISPPTGRSAGTNAPGTDGPSAPPRQPPGHLVVGGRLAVPMRRRSVITAVILLILLIAASVATLSMGRLGIPLAELMTAVAGGADGAPAFVIERLRGPRLVVAIGTGAALGLSGALFQSVTRNPLGSPDVMGLSAGAGAGAAIAALLLPGWLPVPLGALLGALLAMGLVYVSTGTGFRHPGRLVIAGIGVAAMATAVIQYVVYVVERDKATSLMFYVNGSLSVRSWQDALTIWIVLLALAPCVTLIARHLAVGELGDELATGLGSNPGRTRTAAVLLSVALAAGAVAAAGPIAFISLTAPQIAKRVTRGGGPHLLLSALMGALLLVCADLCAQQSPFFGDLPVGIYTMALGGVYLGYLLGREWKRNTL